MNEKWSNYMEKVSNSFQDSMASIDPIYGAQLQKINDEFLHLLPGMDFMTDQDVDTSEKKRDLLLFAVENENACLSEWEPTDPFRFIMLGEMIQLYPTLSYSKKFRTVELAAAICRNFKI